MSEKQLLTLTASQKREQKINQLKKRIDKEEYLLNETKRKERNGQLIAFGVLVEEIFSAPSEAGVFQPVQVRYR
jgi:hypothetical protein